jgi:hypothetical protein
MPTPGRPVLLADDRSEVAATQTSTRKGQGTEGGRRRAALELACTAMAVDRRMISTMQVPS